MMLVTVYTNGQIMLPAEIRLQLDIKAGDSLSFFINDGQGDYYVQNRLRTKNFAGSEQ